MIYDPNGPHFEQGHPREGSPIRSNDPFRRAVHVVLAIYLAPVILAVLAVGGVACVLGWIGRVAFRAGGWYRSLAAAGRRTSSRIDVAYRPGRRTAPLPSQPVAWSEPDRTGRRTLRGGLLAWHDLQGRRSHP